MDALNAMAGTAVWAAKNLAYNLDFIPDDKLNWKPAPEANSAIEIVNHCLGAFSFFGPLIAGGEAGSGGEAQTVSDRESAKQAIVAAAENYAGIVAKIDRSKLEDMIQLPFGAMPLGRIASMGMVDLIHHHGQIAYLQTMLGDTESHFDRSLM